MGIFETLEGSHVLDYHRSQKHVGIAIFWLPTRKCFAKANTAFLDTSYFLISKIHQPTFEYWEYNSYTFTSQIGDNGAYLTVTHSRLIIYFLIFQGTPRPLKGNF